MRPTPAALAAGVALAAGLALGGCSSTLENGELTSTPGVGAAVDGIPYRVRDRVRVQVYEMTDSGYVLAGEQMQDMADPSRLYVLNFKGQMLSNANAKFELRPDGTLIKVHLADKKDFAAVTAAGDAYAGYATTRKTIADEKKARADAALAETKAEIEKALADAEAGRDRADSAADLREVAERAVALAAELPAEAKPSERLEAERLANKAKRAANKAARQAGQDEPYPGV
jgi:hypothetical protein